MIKHSIRLLTLVSFVSIFAYADEVALYKGYFNISYDSSKNSIMAGSTTATAKGYSSLLSNPAGLSTNHNIAIYFKSVEGRITDNDDYLVKEFLSSDHQAAGILYNSLGVEYKADDYIALGYGYGYESKYGLFSAGISYLADVTDLTLKDSSVLARDEFATGSFITYGVMWQKSFVDENDFYAIYIGVSKKNSGVYDGDGNPKIIPVSPNRISYGIGLETNVFGTSILLTTDITEESWESVNETLSGLSHGLKWLIWNSFSVAVGVNEQTFSGATLKNINTLGGGVEFGFFGLHLNAGITQRSMYDNDGLYLKEESAHLDVALTF